ncbi:MAG: MMPL family transporter [Thermoprotei archaeon]
MDVIRHRRIILAVWIIIFLAALPAVIQYGKYINYSTSTSGLANSESARAQNALNKVSPQNQTLLLVVNTTQLNQSASNLTLSFQNKIVGKHIPYLSTVSSPYSAYALFLDHTVGGYRNQIVSVYNNLSHYSNIIYSYPKMFYTVWAALNYTSNINLTAKDSNYNGSSYETAFIANLRNLLYSNPPLPPSHIVQLAAQNAALEVYHQSYYTLYIAKYLNFTDYTDPTTLANATALLIGGLLNFKLSPLIVLAATKPGDLGYNYVESYGLSGAPTFITQPYLSPNREIMLIQINFNVSSGYRGPNNFYPAENATPIIRQIAKQYFGNYAQLTGDGAITYDNQVATQSSGIVFAFTFIFLAVAVAVALRSWIAPLLALVFVSLATLLGYLSIFLTGALIFKVNFIVTYTLTAVILGVATDYLVFILSRYRDGLNEGLESGAALRQATSKAGLAVVISGTTVAASLGTFIFVSGLRSWGPVLFIAVMLTAALEVTLLPAIASYIGPRLFRSPSAKERNPLEYRQSRLYKAAKISLTRSLIVVAVIGLLAAPCVYFWFNVPTSYNFLEGLPDTLPSVHALRVVETSFGSNLLYPIYVVFNLSEPAIQPNGTLSTTALTQINQVENFVANTPGVTKIIGPNTSADSPRQYSPFIFNANKSAYILVYTSYNPYSQQAITLVKHLRSNPNLLVGGLTSLVVDQQAYYARIYTILELAILAAIAVILAVSFRSLKYPFIALTGVFISITWTTTLLYAISEYIFHQTLLYLIPLILYIILMSLGNDFTVFLITRIREEQAKLGFTEGILKGMVGSGTVVTALGLILAVSLGSLGLSPIAFLRQLGLAFIISLVLDTFIIRTFYFPAMIKLLTHSTNKTTHETPRKTHSPTSTPN